MTTGTVMAKLPSNICTDVYKQELENIRSNGQLEDATKFLLERLRVFAISIDVDLNMFVDNVPTKRNHVVCMLKKELKQKHKFSNRVVDLCVVTVLDSLLKLTKKKHEGDF
jgi:hypothetical protein